MQRLEYTDEQFSRLHKADCGLAVYLSSEKIAWSVLDTVHHRVVALTSVQFAKEPAENAWSEAIHHMNERQLGRQQFGRVTVAVDTGHSTLVPQHLFDEEAIAGYLRFSVSAPEQAVKDFIEAIPAYNVYGLHSNFLEALHGVFERFQVMHVATPLLANLLRENRNTMESRLFATLAGSRMHLAAMQQGALTFYNSFPVQTKEDFSYYLLAVAEDLGLHPEAVSVHLAGDILPDSQHYQTAKRFLSDITFADRPKALKYSSKLEAVPRHQHALLYSIHLCA